MNSSFADVLLVPFPFTNQAAVKKRPAVVVSSAPYNDTHRDVIVMAVVASHRRWGLEKLSSTNGKPQVYSNHLVSSLVW
ncbi:type II toxin-antitoxin system PemK/MazF family toxin [Spirulina major]|uniref:type II toxin-antitoxin system PemK/MazF family toxin n=1 Tax=Spirulina major TaxID=270636 RepID=UPI000ABC48BA|nr:type II toxin-antitoxin system PemK/MazF family toxin [Spirulina major]